MNTLKRIVIAFMLLVFSINVLGSTVAHPGMKPIKKEQEMNDSRMFLPNIFYHSYVGLDAGWGDFNFTNANLPGGITAAQIDNQHTILQAVIGHYFNPYIGLQISLMRPIQWVKFHQISGRRGTHTVWLSIFGLTLRPTWPITPRVSLFGLTGLAYISRHGFFANGRNMISDANVLSFLLGGGLNYAITPHWNIQAALSYVFARHQSNQPATLFGSVGAYYYFTPPAPGTVLTTPYIFPKNTLEFGFFTSSLFNCDAGKYLTPPYIPIFWDGDVKLQSGQYLMYTRNIFHTERTFSLDLGASISRYVSNNLHQVFYAFSVFPAIRLWIIRSKEVDFYFFYSIAGPTFITRTVIDNLDTGEHFTFQDLLGFGFYLGRKKHLNLNVKIGHYSNGNLFAQNPGIAVPVSIALGYSF